MNDTNLLLPMRTGEIRIHDAEGFEGMRRAGRLVAECLDMLVPEVKPGVTTEHLDNLVREFVQDNGAVSATIGYRGYRHASCISVNHVICHGIPGGKALKEGDIIYIESRETEIFYTGGLLPGGQFPLHVTMTSMCSEPWHSPAKAPMDRLAALVAVAVSVVWEVRSQRSRQASCSSCEKPTAMDRLRSKSI